MLPSILEPTMNFILVLFCCIFALEAQAQQRFCPGKLDLENPRCLSNANQYKCGVFFLDLPGKEHLSWLGALPDIFKKKSVRESLEVRATLAGASPDSFELTSDKCTGVSKLANARCFTIVSTLSILFVHKYE